MKRVRAAIRTARALLAQGTLGAALQEGILEAHPGLSPKERARVAKKIRPEVGILGHILHDPNQYNSCRTAAENKANHPNKHRLIVTTRTPMCATCSFNKQGRCGLMGGKLVEGVKDISEETVARTARILVDDGALEQGEASMIQKAAIPPARRAASLTLRTTLPVIDADVETRAMQSSRRTAAILDHGESSVTVRAGSMKGPRRTRNADAQEEAATLVEQPGDQRVARRAMAFGNALRPADFQVDLPDNPEPFRKDVRLAARSTFDVPKFTHGTRTASDEEHQGQIQVNYDQIINRSAKVMARGDMTAEGAAKIIAKLDTFEQHGAKATRTARKIITQISALCGHLEL